MFKKIFEGQNFPREKQEFSISSSAIGLLDGQVIDPQVQSWLGQNYPKEHRNKVKSLEISGKGLVGLLDLTDFLNLEELYCYDNQLTGIKFADSSSEKLRVLHVGDNNFSKQSLSLFSHLVGLEVLNLGSNSLSGDLRDLKDLVNLRSLDISDTNIESGLIHLPEKLESLFCQAEKETKCWKIRKELKNYNLGNDCYDFQAWKKDEGWLVMPGSWPKDSKESKSLLIGEASDKEKEFLKSVNRVYQKLVSVKKEAEGIVDLLENDLREIQKFMKEEDIAFSNLEENESKFDFNNLILVAENYISVNKKVWILEEEVKKLKHDNNLLEEKNEFWKYLQLELAERNKEKKYNLMPNQNCIECGKKYEESIYHHNGFGFRYDIHDDKSLGSYLCAGCWKSEGKEIAVVDFEPERVEREEFYDEMYTKYKSKKNTNNIMTNTNANSKKTYILEWKGTDLKNGTGGTKLRYEKFEVIAGSEKEELKFYSTFFTSNNKFKKGEVYELSTPGNFVKDTSGTIPGDFDDSAIIQGIDNGGYEFEKVAPSLMIKELWEEKESNIEKISALEEDLRGRKNDINRRDEELISKKREFNDLQSRFDKLQIEKNNLEEEKEKISEELSSTKTSLQKKEKELADSKSEKSQLQNQVTEFKAEKKRMEDEWLSPESKTKLIQEKEDLKTQSKKEKESLSEQFKKERRDKQLLIETIEELRGQKLKETIEEKLEEKKKGLKQLKAEIIEKLDNQESLLENFLEKQEDFDTALFDDVSQTSRSFLRAKEKLQDARVKLVAKVGSEEVEELCKIQTEISKLEASQKQWEKMEDQQRKEEQEQFESFTETPPKN